jgi:hypothetical protein
MPSNKQAMIERYGSEEAYKTFMTEIGRIGGKRKVPKGKHHKPSQPVA